METKELKILRQAFHGFISPADRLEGQAGSFSCSDAFRETFPKLHNLLVQATVTDITLTRKKSVQASGKLYRSFAWPGSLCWLCTIEPEDAASCELLPEHRLLLDGLGGIQETFHPWDSDEELLTDNKNFLFVGSACRRALDDDWTYYMEECEEERTKPLVLDNLILFAEDANGDSSYYDLQTRQVLVFAHDHCSKILRLVEGQQEYTWHTIQGITDFTAYVETLAWQWLQMLEGVRAHS